MLKHELKKEIKESIVGDEKKVFSKTQYDEAVRNAAQQAATDAVKSLRKLDKDNVEENKKSLLKIGQMKKDTKDEALEVEKAIKVAVSKEAGVVESKLKNDGLLKTPITGRDIIGQMKSYQGDPVGNHLNAATAAGIEMAREAL